MKISSLTLGLCLVVSLVNAQKSADKPSSRQVIVEAKPSAKEAAVLEAALRDILSDAKAEETVFVSFGTLTEPYHQDPPADLLKRFEDLKLKIRPISAARLPKPGEKDTATRYRGIEDPETGKRSYAYSVRVKEWASETKVRVDFRVGSGPLSGYGGTYIYELRDGKWGRTSRESIWVS